MNSATTALRAATVHAAAHANLRRLEQQLREVAASNNATIVEHTRQYGWPDYLSGCAQLERVPDPELIRFWQPDLVLTIKQRRLQLEQQQEQLQQQFDQLQAECGKRGHQLEQISSSRGHDGYGNTNQYHEHHRCSQCGHSQFHTTSG